jgi:uncharacterized damage-inducible protein DinB
MMKKLLLIAMMFVSVQLFAQGQLQKESVGNITYASDHIMQLADAFPADKYSWAPEEGVRSFAGVCAHIISANYFFGSKLGATLPEGVNPMTIEQELTEKEEIKSALKQSYDILLAAISNTKDESLPLKVEYPFPGEFTNMSSILIALSHTNEHLGQLIAYSRMNGVTPPWSGTEGGE